ncbi:MAG: heme-copper oxidase subunit III [Acidobacteria bacterium]|nr:MAG: heme-copper oxidase subunit III [Acidobacteriota bacterium]
MASLTTTATVMEPEISRVGLLDYGTRLRRARLGLLVALIPVLMLFVSFTSAYVVRQGLPSLDPRTNNLIRDWIPVALPRLLLLNTFVLLVSSVSMELARRQIRARAVMETNSTGTGVSSSDPTRMPWLGMTLVLGFAFLFGQWTAWKQLAANGFYVSTTPSSSFIYLLTGAHAAHLLGGVVALLIASVAALLHRSLKTRSIVVDVTAWYWHFMALLWIYIFGLMKFVS